MLEQLPFLTTLADSQLLLALAFIAMTAAVMGSGVPGLLLPLSFSSGMLLGGWLGIAVVAAGALLGSQVLFAVSRKWLAGPIRRKWGAKLEKFDRNLAKRGFLYLLGMRLLGAPHPLVTAASAVSPIPARQFALATLLGFIPAIALAATAGSVI